MSTNYVQPGNTVTVVMPYAATSGVGVQVGSGLFGVAEATYASGATGVLGREGVYTGLAKTSGTGEAFAVGDRLFWDNSTKKLTKTSTGNLCVGICLETVATGVTTAGAVLIEAVTPAGT